MPSCRVGWDHMHCCRGSAVSGDGQKCQCQIQAATVRLFEKEIELYVISITMIAEAMFLNDRI